MSKLERSMADDVLGREGTSQNPSAHARSTAPCDILIINDDGGVSPDLFLSLASVDRDNGCLDATTSL